MATNPSLRESALAVLGLADPVSPSEVIKAYRQLAKATHPDATGSTQPGAGPSFATINDAYRTAISTPRPDVAETTPTSPRSRPEPTPAAPPPRSTPAAPTPAPRAPRWRRFGADIAVGPVVVSPPRTGRTPP
jgi:hypothetical protein